MSVEPLEIFNWRQYANWCESISDLLFSRNPSDFSRCDCIKSYPKNNKHKSYSLTPTPFSELNVVQTESFSNIILRYCIYKVNPIFKSNILRIYFIKDKGYTFLINSLKSEKLGVYHHHKVYNKIDKILLVK